MEVGEFIHDSVNQSIQDFQTGQFLKENSGVCIADTIPEQSVVTNDILSSSSLKMEVPEVTSESFLRDERDNNCSQTIKSDESSNASTIIAVDNSYLINCEKKLLENSSSEEEKSFLLVNKSVSNEHLRGVPRQLHETISTPPSELRKQIDTLRNEIAETDEFHDLEIQILKEEQEDAGPENYLELFEKYSALLELYETLKNEYDEYRNKQEKVRDELHSKTADCLESLCSQIEASDNSLNFSGVSFASFNTEIKSSTMLGNISEVETTVVNDVTMLNQDPLALTIDGMFKMPKQTSLNSSRKLLPQEWSSSKGKGLVKEIGNIDKTSSKQDIIEIETDQSDKILELETVLYEKIKEAEDLEKRLLKLEELSTVLHEFERKYSVVLEESTSLKKSLKQKTEQLDELTEKLFTETVELNPSLKDSIIDAPGSKLLSVFLNTIMESCKTIEDTLTKKFGAEKNEWEMQKKNDSALIENLQNQIKSLSEQITSQESKVLEFCDLEKKYNELKEQMRESENIIATRDEEIRLLQNHETFSKQTREKLTLVEEELLRLKSQLDSVESEKSELETRCQALQESNTVWQSEKTELENMCQSLQQNITNLETAKSELEAKCQSLQETSNEVWQKEKAELETRCQSLQQDIANLEVEKSELEGRCKSLQESSDEVWQKERTELEVRCQSMQQDIKNFETTKTELESRCQSLQENNEIWQKEKAKLETKCQSLQQDVTNLEAAKSDLEARCQFFQETSNEVWQKEKTELETRCQSLLQDISNLEAAKLEFEAKWQALQESNKIWENEKTELENTCQSLQQNITNLETVKSELEARCQSLQETSNEAWQKEKAELETRCQSLQQDIANLEAEKSELEGRCQSLQENNNEIWEKEKAELENRCESLQLNITNLETAKSELETQIRIFQENTIIWQNERDRIETECQTLRQSIDSLEAKKSELETQFRTLQESNACLEKEKSDWETRCENLQELNVNLEVDKSKLQTQYQALLDGKNNWEAEKYEFETRYQALQERTDGLEVEKSELETRCRSLEEKVVGFETNNSELQTLYQTLSESSSIWQKEKLELENKCQALQERNTNLETEKLELEKRCQTLQESSDKWEMEKSELETQYKTLEELKIALETQNSDLEVQYRSLLENNNNLKIEKAALETRHQDLEDKRAAWETQKLGLETQCQTLQEGNIHLQEQSTKLETEISELKSRCEGLEKGESNWQKKIFEFEARYHILKERNLTLETEKIELETRYQSFQGGDNWQVEKSHLETKIQALLESNICLETEKTHLETRCQVLEERCVALQTSKSELEDQYQVLQEEKSELDKNYGSVQERNSNLEGEKLALETQNANSKETIASLEAEKSEWETRYQILQEGNANLEAEISKLETQYQTLKERNMVLENEKTELETKCQKLEQDVLNLETEKSELKTLCQTLQKGESYWQTEKSEMETRCQVLQQTNMNLETEKSDLETRYRSLEEGRNNWETEKTELETRCQALQEGNDNLLSEINTKEALLKDLEKSNSFYNKVQHENDDLKERILKSEEIMGNLKIELERAKEEQNKNEYKVEELIREIDSLKSENCFSPLIKALEESKKNVADVLLDFETYEDVPYDAIHKVVEETIESNPRLKDTKGSKVLSMFTETVMESRRDVQEALTKKLNKEIESMKNADATLIENLRNQIKTLNDINEDYEAKMFQKNVERDDFKKLYEDSRNQLSKAEDLISHREEEIRVLQSHEENLKKAKDELASADETISKLKTELISAENRRSEMKNENEDLKRLYDGLRDRMTEVENMVSSRDEEIRILKSYEIEMKLTKENLIVTEETVLKLKTQLSVAEEEKREKENLCRKLEIELANCQTEIDTKETILKGLQEMLTSRERIETENVDLKMQIEKSENVITNLRTELQVANGEQNSKMMKIEELMKEISSLKKEEEILNDLQDKLKVAEENKKNLADVLLDIQSCLDMPDDTMSKLLSGNFENRKIFTERINSLMKTQLENLKSENKTLACGNENLKEKVRELSKIISQTTNSQLKEEMSSLNNSLPPSSRLRSKSGKSIDLYMKRLDKLEEINFSLTDLLTQILTATEFPNLEKIKWSSLRDFPNINKQVMDHVKRLQSSMKELNELRETNAILDEECDSYAKTIKDLKKEAVAVWKANKEKTEALESEISRLRKEKECLDGEKQDLLTKISKLDAEYQKLKSAIKTEGSTHNCNCGNEVKKINEMKRTLLIKEQKILELQDLENQSTVYKSQIRYLENALDQEKKKNGEEREKTRKLQNEVKELKENQKSGVKRKSEENDMLDELRMRGTFTGGVVQEFGDREKMKKLTKDIGILKELCRARYAEIKRLEKENACLRNMSSKNSNQMDSPLRTRTYNTRSKNVTKETWKPEPTGKENALV